MGMLSIWYIFFTEATLHITSVLTKACHFIIGRRDIDGTYATVTTAHTIMPLCYLLLHYAGHFKDSCDCPKSDGRQNGSVLALTVVAQP